MPDQRTDLLYASIRRTRNISFSVGSVLLLFGTGMIIGGFVAEESAGTLVFLILFGALTMGFGGLVFWMGWRNRRPETSVIARQLTQKPGDICWIYIEQIQSGAYGAKVGKGQLTIKLGLVTGKTLSLSVAHGNAEEIMELLGEMVPGATKGHSSEREKSFAKDPSSLKVALADPAPVRVGSQS